MKNFKLSIIEHTNNLYHAIDNLYGIQVIIRKNGDDNYEGKLIDQSIVIRTSQGDSLEAVVNYLFSELSRILVKHSLKDSE